MPFAKSQLKAERAAAAVEMDTRAESAAGGAAPELKHKVPSPQRAAAGDAAATE